MGKWLFTLRQYTVYARAETDKLIGHGGKHTVFDLISTRVQITMSLPT
jgi:hypothetical protein